MSTSPVFLILLLSMGMVNCFWLFNFPSNSGKQGTCPTAIVTFPCKKCTADNQCSGNLLCCPSPINQAMPVNGTLNLCCSPATLGG